MTEKNRSRLRVLQDPANQIRVLNLPDRIFARPLGDGGARSIFAREDALAIAILLTCPIRAKSLAELELGRHIQRPGDGKVYLVREEADTKIGRPIEFELPRDGVRLLDAHLKTRVPHMCPPGTPYLFPQRSGARPVDPSCLATRIAKRVRRETGFEMNAHLFRHFAVMLWLDANPGGYEVAQRLLGHSELSHTINIYSGLEVRPRWPSRILSRTGRRAGDEPHPPLRPMACPRPGTLGEPVHGRRPARRRGASGSPSTDLPSLIAPALRTLAEVARGHAS